MQNNKKKPSFFDLKRLILYASLILIGIITLFLYLQPTVIEKESKKSELTKKPDERAKMTTQSDASSPKADILKERLIQVTDEILIKSVKIKPTNPTITDSLKSELELLRNPSEKNITLKYEWLVNGKPLEGVTGDTLPAGKTKKGDYVNLRIGALKNAKVLQYISSNFVMIQNSPPSLNIKILKNNISRLGGAIEIQLISSDPDGDKITYSLEEAPPNASFDPQNGRITYYPDKVGPRTVNFKVSAIDSDGAKTTANFEIHLSNVGNK